MPQEFETIPADLVLPDLLNGCGMLRLLPASEYDEIPSINLRSWCRWYARYGLPTLELVAWLSVLTNGRKTIEIGSGTGDLAYYLDIQATDSKLQERPEILTFYKGLGQPVICYPDWVEELDALDAVIKYKPEIVIGSWVTEWIDGDVPPPPGGGSIFGVKEDLILAQGVVYVLIGNRDIHGTKKIMDLPHEEYPLPFLRSRAKNPENNVVYIWGR
jgi:hypothetical protein